MAIDYDRFKAVDFTYPYYMDIITFTSPPPQYKYFANLLDVFDIYIWICLLTSILFLWSLVSLKKFTNPFMIITIALKQSLKLSNLRTFPTKLIVGLWLLACLILTASYAGYVHSVIALPTEIKFETPDALAQLAQNNGLRFICYNRAPSCSFILVLVQY